MEGLEVSSAAEALLDVFHQIVADVSLLGRMSFDFDTIACQINQGGKVVDGDDYDEGAEIE